MNRPGNSVSVRDAIPYLFPNASGEWESWLTQLEELDIDTIGDVCIIERRLWEGLKFPSLLQEGLSLIRSTPEGGVLPLLPSPSISSSSSSSSSTSSAPIDTPMRTSQHSFASSCVPNSSIQSAPDALTPSKIDHTITENTTSTPPSSERLSLDLRSRHSTANSTTDLPPPPATPNGTSALASGSTDGIIQTPSRESANQTVNALSPGTGHDGAGITRKLSVREGSSNGHDDEDSEDSEGGHVDTTLTPKKLGMSSRPSFRQPRAIVHHAELKPVRQHETFTVVKSNQLGIGQTRVISVDEQAVTLRFSDPQMKLRMEVPLGKVTIASVENNERKIAIAFKERDRVYDITFADAQACRRFQALAKEIQSQAHLPPRSPQASSRQLVPGSPAPPDEMEVSAHEEYKVVKKNRFKQRQQRILVLKPMTVVLLDECRKFIKAFKYEQIHSVEIVAGEAKKNAEAEIFLVFTPAVGQRPFQCFFASTLERTHFFLCLKSYHRTLVLKDMVHVDRFVITKLATNSARVQGKRRILEVLPARSVIRSYDRIMQFKDTDISRVKSVAPDAHDPCRLYFTTTKKFIYDFSDHLARTHFLSLVFFMLDSITHQSPGKAISIFCGSWVAGTCVPTKTNTWEHWIPPSKYDLYVIGLQKVHHSYKSEWPLHLHRMIEDHPLDFVALSEKDRDMQSNYHVLVVHQVGELILVVFIRKPLAYKVTYLDVASCLNPEGLQRKGAIAVCLTYEDTALCFVTSHFKGKSDKLKERRADYTRVLKGLKFKKEGDLLVQHDHIFWFGNLNYRLDKSFTEALMLTDAMAVDQLVASDQLLKEMYKKDPIFLGFQEGKINFLPTHQKGITKQVASYTDRVLWRSLHPTAVALQEYGCAHDILGSFHRPVFGVFTLAPRSYKWAGYNAVGRIVELSLFDLLFKSDVVSPEAELQLVVSGPFLEHSFESKVAKFEKESWSWFLTGSFRAHVQPEHLPLLHLTLTLKETRTRLAKNGKPEEQLVYGFCNVPLGPNKTTFRLAFIKEGLVVGIVTGNVMVKASEDEGKV